MEMNTFKNIFKIFNIDNSTEYPRLSINLIGGIVVNIDNIEDNKITLTNDSLLVENCKCISVISLDDVIKVTIHKQ